VNRGGLDHVRRNPRGCARWLTTAGVVAGVDAAVALHDHVVTVFDTHFAPPPPDLPGYPAEHVRISVTAQGWIAAVPVDGETRPWLHRYPRHPIDELARLPLDTEVPWEQLVGSLCLWYPADPAHLRWHWHDGIDAYLRIVQRHLWCEEYWRRHDSWPVEDTPHGARPDGLSHPILTPALRSA
jgi:hypothetical protein